MYQIIAAVYTNSLYSLYANIEELPSVEIIIIKSQVLIVIIGLRLWR